jgi:GTPase SAR1 family protein
LFVIGNKTDYEREIETDEGIALAESIGAACGYFETSAKTGSGIEELVDGIFQELRSLRESPSALASVLEGVTEAAQAQ